MGSNCPTPLNEWLDLQPTRPVSSISPEILNPVNAATAQTNMTLQPLITAVVILLLPLLAQAAPVHLVDEAPVKISTAAPGIFLVDFGRVAFGNLRLTPPAGATQEIKIHLGEP